MSFFKKRELSAWKKYLNNAVLTTPKSAWWDVISPCLRAPPNGIKEKASAFQIFCYRRPFIFILWVVKMEGEESCAYFDFWSKEQSANENSVLGYPLQVIMWNLDIL